MNALETAPQPSTPPAEPGFAELGLPPALCQALAELGYEAPTPIQRAAVPALLAGRDVLGQAATGTGKTAAFALPLLARLAAGERKAGPRALVLVPTRELAVQVAQAVHKYASKLEVRTLAIYGGQPFGPQLRALERGVDVVVATPGRALDHLNRGTLALEGLELLVLDEADEMLDMGFADELEALLEATPATRQTALFSATLAPSILGIAEQHLKKPARITIERETTPEGELPRVRQAAYLVPRASKSDALARVLELERPKAALVFCRTRVEVDELTEILNRRGLRAEALHGGFAQDQRERVMNRFRAAESGLLVATDVAARGLDIGHLSHVVNYDVPASRDDYVHRIGRTGRAGREGVAITFLEPREKGLVVGMERVTGQTVERATLPDLATLRAKRLERLGEELKLRLAGPALDGERAFLATLTDVAPQDLAAAALALLSERLHGGGEEREIELTPARRERPDHAHERFQPKRPGATPRRTSDFEGTRLFIGLGKDADLRPGDLVGAITNEAGVPSAAIGSIRINERFTLVDVRPEIADDVIQALRRTTIRGRKVNVRRDREG
jgi:ATP-dependent RNA helicase DeaD